MLNNLFYLYINMGEFRISGVVRIGGARKSVAELMRPYLKKKKKAKPKPRVDMRERSDIRLDPTRHQEQEKRYLSGDHARDQRDLNQRRYSAISSRNIINNKTRALVQDATNLHPQIGYLHPDVQAGVGSQLIRAGYGAGASLTQAVRPQDAPPSEDIYEILGRYDQGLRNTLSVRDKQYQQLAGAFYDSQQKDRDLFSAEVRRLEQKQLAGQTLSPEESSKLNSSRLKIDQLNRQLHHQVEINKTATRQHVKYSDKQKQLREIKGLTGQRKLAKTAEYIFGVPKETASILQPLEGDHRTLRGKLNTWADTGKNHVTPEHIHDFLSSTNIHEHGDYHHLLPRLRSEQRRDYLDDIGLDAIASDESDRYEKERKAGTLYTRGFGEQKYYEPTGFGDSTDEPDRGKEGKSIRIVVKKKGKGKAGSSGITASGNVHPQGSLHAALFGQSSTPSEGETSSS